MGFLAVDVFCCCHVSKVSRLWQLSTKIPTLREVIASRLEQETPKLMSCEIELDKPIL